MEAHAARLRTLESRNGPGQIPFCTKADNECVRAPIWQSAQPAFSGLRVPTAADLSEIGVACAQVFAKLVDGQIDKATAWLLDARALRGACASDFAALVTGRLPYLGARFVALRYRRQLSISSGTAPQYLSSRRRCWAPLLPIRSTQKRSLQWRLALIYSVSAYLSVVSCGSV